MLQQLSGINGAVAFRRFPFTTAIFVAFCVSAGSGCAVLKRQLIVKVAIVPGANGNNPVALDVVSIKDKDLGKEIAKLTAADWFEKREQYLRDNSKPGVLSVKSGEWVPGQAVPSVALPAPLPVPIPLLSSSPTVVAFARYFSPGPHRAKLQPNKVSTIELGLEDLVVTTDKK